MQKVIENIRLHIANDNLTNASDLIISCCNTAVRDRLNEAIIISRELNAVLEASRTGTISWEEENRFKNKLAHRMLKIVDVVSFSKS